MCLGAININPPTPPRGLSGTFHIPLVLSFPGLPRDHIECSLKILRREKRRSRHHRVLAIAPPPRPPPALLLPRCLSALVGQQLPSAGGSSSLLSVWKKKKKEAEWHGGFFDMLPQIVLRACAHNCSWQAARLLRSSAGQMFFTTAL